MMLSVVRTSRHHGKSASVVEKSRSTPLGDFVRDFLLTQALFSASEPPAFQWWSPLRLQLGRSLVFEFCGHSLSEVRLTESPSLIPCPLTANPVPQSHRG